jgi:uncharacterized protein GlcG (DUF336 family)
MTLLSLDDAQSIVNHAIQSARTNGFEPMTVVVLDAAGVMKASAREDGSGLIRPDIAHAKAWGALGMGLPTRELGRRAELMPAFFQALAPVSQGRMLPVPGGVLIMRDGTIVGAVGASGDTSDNDEVCAVAGIEAAGLVADAAAEPPIRHSAF